MTFVRHFFSHLFGPLMVSKIMQCNVVCLVHDESLISINLVTSTKGEGN